MREMRERIPEVRLVIRHYQTVAAGARIRGRWVDYQADGGRLYRIFCGAEDRARTMREMIMFINEYLSQGKRRRCRLADVLDAYFVYKKIGGTHNDNN